jgi:hypothetical protein
MKAWEKQELFAGRSLALPLLDVKENCGSNRGSVKSIKLVTS